jgi:hypothetical protein
MRPIIPVGCYDLGVWVKFFMRPQGLSNTENAFGSESDALGRQPRLSMTRAEADFTRATRAREARRHAERVRIHLSQVTRWSRRGPFMRGDLPVVTVWVLHHRTTVTVR